MGELLLSQPFRIRKPFQPFSEGMNTTLIGSVATLPNSEAISTRMEGPRNGGKVRVATLPNSEAISTRGGKDGNY
jgi:hypothetical protein